GHNSVTLARNDRPLGRGDLRDQPHVTFCKTPAQLRPARVRTELSIANPFPSTELLQRATTCPTTDEHKAESAVVTKLSHCFGNRMLLVGQAKGSRVLNHQRALLERTRYNLVSVSPVFRHNNLVLRNPAGDQP